MRWDQLIGKILFVVKMVGYLAIAWYTYASFISKGVHIDKGIVESLIDSPLAKWGMAVAVAEVIHNLWSLLGLGEK